jgi:hypothetical protein
MPAASLLSILLQVTWLALLPVPGPAVDDTSPGSDGTDIVWVRACGSRPEVFGVFAPDASSGPSALITRLFPGNKASPIIALRHPGPLSNPVALHVKMLC